MSAFLQKEIKKLKEKILELGEMVESKVRDATQALLKKDEALAQKIIKTDYEVDEMEVDVEEECLKLLALYQPVASDLRFITAVIKINNDLERIADIAVNIANRVVEVSKHKEVYFNFDYKPMIKKTKSMLKNSLDSLVDIDGDIARSVLIMDDEIDDINKEAYEFAKKEFLKSSNEEEVGVYINKYLVSRHLERLADHATNIAEEIIYIVDGEIIRHTI